MAPASGGALPIVGFILAIIIPPVGLVISIIARVQSSKAGRKSLLALVGIIIGIVFTLGWIGGGIGIGVAVSHLANICSTLGPGVHQSGGATYTCG